LAGQLGYCGEGSQMRIALASIHSGEEPPITGKGGSGTIFFPAVISNACFAKTIKYPTSVWAA
jgi:putative pyruvate formate lyase activating enzyme